jgi:serine protease Do
MKKVFIPSLLVMIVLLLGMLLAYFLYTLDSPKQDKVAAPEVKTEIVEKEVKVPVKVPVKVSEKSSLKKIIKATQSKVVQIETASGSQGSGFLYNDRGDIVTNAHVVGYEVKVTIKTSDQQIYQGQVIGRSEDTDIALVRVVGLADIAPLKMRQKKAELGDDVVAMGSPLGLQNTVTVGIISGLDRSFQGESFYYENMYQITAPVSPGNSGGPIVSGTDGSVLGINSVKHTTEHIGFSIPMYTVLPTLKSWSDNPMNLTVYEEEYEFELPEYDGDLYGDYGEHEEEKTYEDYESYEGDTEYYDFIPDDALTVVYTYYDYVNTGQYEQAYDLIGGNWKASSPSIDEFAAGYAQTLHTTIIDPSVYDNGDGTYQVDLTIEAQEFVHEAERTSYYDLSYVVGLENDQLKLLGGETR